MYERKGVININHNISTSLCHPIKHEKLHSSITLVNTIEITYLEKAIKPARTFVFCPDGFYCHSLFDPKVSRLQG